VVERRQYPLRLRTIEHAMDPCQVAEARRHESPHVRRMMAREVGTLVLYPGAIRIVKCDADQRITNRRNIGASETAFCVPPVLGRGLGVAIVIQGSPLLRRIRR